MKLIVKFWGDTENPRNFPAGYPAEAMEINDKDPIPDGWTLTTKEAYQKAINDHQEDVIAINKAVEDQELAQIETTKQETAIEIEALQVHVESVNLGQATDGDRLAAVDNVASLLVKFAPVLEQLLAQIQTSNQEPLNP